MTGRCGLPDKTSASPCFATPHASPPRIASFTGCSNFPRRTSTTAGQPLANGGFDAVLGNPPWDMLRAGGAEKTFFRSSGVYRHQGAGHINRYQMFVERALTLTKRRRPNRSRPAGRLRHRSHVSAAAARAPEPHERRHHQRLRQSARHISDSQKRSISHLHVDRGRRDATYRLPLRHRRPGRARDDSRRRRPAGRPLASDRADALVSRSAQRTHACHTRAAQRDRPAHPRARRPQHSRGWTPRTDGTCGSAAS